MVRITAPCFPKTQREHRGLKRASRGEVAGATSGAIAPFEVGDAARRRSGSGWRTLPDMRPGDLMTSDPSEG